MRCSSLEQCDAWLSDLIFFRLIPVMVTRMVISLKKVASERQPLSLENPTSFPMGLQDDYSAHAVNGIPLSVLKVERA